MVRDIKRREKLLTLQLDEPNGVSAADVYATCGDSCDRLRASNGGRVDGDLFLLDEAAPARHRVVRLELLARAAGGAEPGNVGDSRRVAAMSAQAHRMLACLWWQARYRDGTASVEVGAQAHSAGLQSCALLGCAHAAFSAYSGPITCVPQDFTKRFAAGCGVMAAKSVEGVLCKTCKA